MINEIIENITYITRGGYRAAAASKMERFVIIVNGLQPLTIITKRSILDVAAALDPPLITVISKKKSFSDRIKTHLLRTGHENYTLQIENLENLLSDICSKSIIEFVDHVYKIKQKLLSKNCHSETG